MKCDECRQQTEAYFDGELDARTTENIAIHLAACASCASLFDELEGEAEVYKSYERDIELSPALWTAIEARLAVEPVGGRARQSHSTARLRAWLAGAVATPRVAFGATAATVFACLIIAAALYNGGREATPQQEIANVRGQIEQLAAAGRTVATSNTKSERAPTPEGHDQVPQSGTSHANANQSRIQASLKSKESNIRLVSKGKRDTTQGMLASDRRRIRAQTGRDLAPASIAGADVVVARITERPNEAQGGFEDVWQRHAEQSQLLLRSFRNARGRGETVDVAYERAQARRLLSRNIVLRRDAARRGRVLTEETLSRLEPVLLDIANLPAKTSPEDVRAVNARINEGEFVATLHAQSTLLARTN